MNTNYDYVIQASTVFVDGVGKIGFCEKMTTPKLKKKGEDFRPSGVLVGRRVFFGLDPMEFEFELNAYDPQVIQQVGLTKRSVPLSFRGFAHGDENKEHTITLVCESEFEEVDPGTWEGGKKSMLKIRGVLTAAKLTVDGTEIYDIDARRGVYTFGGVDEMAPVRAALGY